MTSITSVVESFNEVEILRIAKEICFSKRNRKIDPITFCRTLINVLFELKEYFLDLFCDYARGIKEDFELSKQALHKKMKEGSKLLKSLLLFLLYDVRQTHHTCYDNENVFLYKTETVCRESAIYKHSKVLTNDFKSFNENGLIMEL